MNAPATMFHPSDADLGEGQRHVDCDLDGHEVVVVWQRISRADMGTVVGVWVGECYFEAERFSQAAVADLQRQCRRADERREEAADWAWAGVRL